MKRLQILDDIRKHLFVDEFDIVCHMATELREDELEPVVLDNPEDRTGFVEKDLIRKIIETILFLESEKNSEIREIQFEYAIDLLKQMFNISDEQIKEFKK